MHSGKHRRVVSDAHSVFESSQRVGDVALVDNALLEPVARACVEEGRDDFMLVIAPLRVVGGTGSPANPLAVF